MATKRLQESTAGFAQIDREAGVIRGVKILGLKSRNKRGSRRYLKEASSAGAPLYEGRKVYIDHVQLVEGKAPARPTRERWGKLVNVAPDESGELYGDLEYLKSHELTEQILEAAERFNDFGLSHDADGKVRESEGEEVVYELTKVFSVDVVQEPATNRNLFESLETMERKNIRAALREHIKQPHATFLLARLTEMEDIYAEDMEMEVAPEASPEDQIKEAFRTAILAIVDGEGDVDDVIAKIKLLLETKAEVSGEGTSEPTSKTETEGETMTESQAAELQAENKRLKEQLAQQTTKEACTKLLESLDREATPVRVKALAALTEEADRKSLVESWPVRTSKRPESSPPKYSLQEQEHSELPKTYDDVKRLLDI